MNATVQVKTKTKITDYECHLVVKNKNVGIPIPKGDYNIYIRGRVHII